MTTRPDPLPGSPRQSPPGWTHECQWCMNKCRSSVCKPCVKANARAARRGDKGYIHPDDPTYPADLSRLLDDPD